MGEFSNGSFMVNDYIQLGGDFNSFISDVLLWVVVIGAFLIS
jgi:hypothetical protein